MKKLLILLMLLLVMCGCTFTRVDESKTEETKDEVKDFKGINSRSDANRAQDDFGLRSRAVVEIECSLAPLFRQEWKELPIVLPFVMDFVRIMTRTPSSIRFKTE